MLGGSHEVAVSIAEPIAVSFLPRGIVFPPGGPRSQGSCFWVYSPLGSGASSDFRP